MDLQVASLKTVLESLKLETIRYLAGKHVGASSEGWTWGFSVILWILVEGFFACAPPQRRCSPAWPSLWESTGCGGEGSTSNHKLMGLTRLHPGHKVEENSLRSADERLGCHFKMCCCNKMSQFNGPVCRI